eukprot:4870943-Lingulodinium_polyedra.AAC.1
MLCDPRARECRSRHGPRRPRAELCPARWGGALARAEEAQESADEARQAENVPREIAELGFG